MAFSKALAAQIAVGALISGLVVLSWNDANAPRPALPQIVATTTGPASEPPYDTYGRPSHRVIVNGTEFLIPAPYEFPIFGISADPPGFMLLAHFPSMEGSTPATEHEFAYAGLNNIIWISSSEINREPNDHVQLVVDIRSPMFVGPTEELPAQHGLRRYFAVGMRDRYTDNISRQDYFVPTQSLGRPVHIFCTSALAETPRQTCAEYTTFRELSVEFAFDRRLLHRWREVHDKSIALLTVLADRRDFEATDALALAHRP